MVLKFTKNNILLFFYVLMYPFSQAGISPFNSIYIPEGFNYVALVSFFCLIFFNINKKTKIEKDIVYFLFIWVMLLPSFMMSLDYIFIIIYIILMYFNISKLHINNSDIDFIKYGFYFGLLLSWLAIFYNYEGLARYSGYFNNPNAFGFYGVSVVVFSFYFNKINYFMLFSGVVFVMMSGSRSSLLCLFVFLMLMTKNKVLIYTLSISLICLVFYLFNEEISMFLRFGDDLNDISSGRTMIYEKIINAKKVNFFIPEDVTKYIELANTGNFHNSFVKIYSSGGIVLFSIYIISIVLILYMLNNPLFKKALFIFILFNLFEDFFFSMNGIYFYTLTILLIMKAQEKCYEK